MSKAKLTKGGIDIGQLLLSSRQINLTGRICPKVVQPVINQIMALQLISKKPIIIWINSPGGYCTDGFALVDTILMSDAPIYTVIKGQACSMAAVISVAGHKRLMTGNSVWMAHDVFGGAVDYAEKALARLKDCTKVLQKQVFKFWKEHTELSDKDLAKAKYQELWLSPQQCLDKGVVDEIYVMKKERKNKK